MKLIDKAAVVAEIEKLKDKAIDSDDRMKWYLYNDIIKAINTLEVIDPYDKFIQYQSVEDGIKAHAETYSFNIESELFNQLTKEQQALWRKEIEQACISGGEVGVELARDVRYKENIEVKKVDLEKEMQAFAKMELEPLEIHDDNIGISITMSQLYSCARNFFKLGLKAKKGE